MRNRGINTISTIRFASQINVLSIADIAEQLTQIPAQIKDVNVTALLDTGASVCFGAYSSLGIRFFGHTELELIPLLDSHHSCSQLVER